jgi:hypothetical protein
MWSDNETEIDLLGFGYLVDELIVALTNPSLLPLTVGVLGEWGSGKSSLLAIAKRELDESKDGSYLTVAFSPWQHEDYDDIKLALMKAVLDACESELGDSPQLRGLKKFLRVMGLVGRRVARLGVRTGAVAVSSMAAAEGELDPQSAVLLNTALTTSADILEEEFKKDPDSDGVVPIASLEAFRETYNALVGQLKSAALVVFIDDLDRCLPNTVVDTFEAIRLFLNAPKTAFVVALHRELAEAAVDAAFVDYGRLHGRGLGHDYLEKMLQLQVTVPRLSDDDAAAYVGLLLAQLRLDSTHFEALMSAVAVRRAEQPFERAFDLQFAAQQLEQNLTTGLRDDLKWAEAIIPLVNGVLRANPRQIKRFLNDLRLREGAARRRKIVLKPATLAKLLALHEVDFEAFQTLFEWQLSLEGPIAELKVAETASRVATGESEDVKPAGVAAAGKAKGGKAPAPAVVNVPDHVHEWMSRSSVGKWLAVDPLLGEEDIRPYFTYFRSKLVVAPQLTRLSPMLQTLLARLSSEVSTVRRGAADNFAALATGDQGQVWGVVESYLRAQPDSVWWDAAAEIASRVAGHASALTALLSKIPDNAIPSARVFTLVSRLPEGAERNALVAKWRGSSVKPLATAADIAATKGA